MPNTRGFSVRKGPFCRSVRLAAPAGYRLALRFPGSWHDGIRGRIRNARVGYVTSSRALTAAKRWKYRQERLAEAGVTDFLAAPFPVATDSAGSLSRIREFLKGELA